MKWVNENTGVGVDDIGFTLIDLNRIAYVDEPFIMAKQEKQAKHVFYCPRSV